MGHLYRRAAEQVTAVCLDHSPVNAAVIAHVLLSAVSIDAAAAAAAAAATYRTASFRPRASQRSCLQVV